MSLRFTADAARRLRDAIAEAHGVEVFAIGDVEGGSVTALTVTCRGRRDQVTALLDRPRAGQVVIHNHPSGDLTPSEPDLQLAGMYGDNGVGMVIVDSKVARSNWVVEPHVSKDKAVDPASVEAFFGVGLPRALPDFEPRPGQLDMAREVGRALSQNRPYVVEAGTGTGKSLAYLVPAALWALANDGKVVVSTFTKALQGQLLRSDLPLLDKGGLKVRSAVLQGRNNYLCKRRLALAVEEDRGLAPDLRVELETIAAWEEASADGSRGDLPLSIDPALWERIESDSDLTLRVRCPHYESCRFYQARRRAAAADVVVVNHALLLADLSIREAGGQGLLPKYARLVLDEAHHLEEAATGALASRLTARAIERVVSPLLGRKRPGTLARLLDRHGQPKSSLPADRRQALPDAVHVAIDHVGALHTQAGAALSILAVDALPCGDSALRITPELERTDAWRDVIAPRVAELASALESAAGAIDAVSALFLDVPLKEDESQPVLDLSRGLRRLVGQAKTARAFLQEDQGVCRWIERVRTRGWVPEVSLHLAPIEIAALLRKILWEPLPGSVATSATLTVRGRFDFWLERTGLDDAPTGTLPSPFDHFTQAILGLPRDLPEPDDSGFFDASSAVVVDAVRLSDGGAFVLCTSYAAVETYARALRSALPPEQPVLVQGASGRSALLERFMDNRRAVLVGTDSFWEGVSVKGDGLRMVIIPRLPFRVPTEPLRMARHDRITARGGDPFKTFTLPEAVLKLRQGYGRLIRHRGDRGVVLLLDRRLHGRSYGPVMLQSLPPARRVTGPWLRVREELERFFRPP
jgi:ATP-dependent DNA helicase DinG